MWLVFLPQKQVSIRTNRGEVTIMEHTRVTESRTLVYSACRRALDSHGEEPSPPLTGEGFEIESTYGYLKPLLETVDEAMVSEDAQKLIEATEEVVVESLFLLARVMELTDLYSDSGVETPLTAACYYALGSYMEQEQHKEDQWRDASLETLSSNAIAELQEIRENTADDDLDSLLRNSVDFVLLVSILFAAVLDRQDEF